MADLAALAVRLELQSQAFEKGVSQATKSMQRMEARVKSNGRQLQVMAKAAAAARRGLAGIATAVAATFTTRQVKQAIEFGDALGKTAGAVGLTVESLQAYQYAAERGGVATSQFNSNMTAFVKRMGELRNNTGPLVSGLKGMNDELLDNLKNARDQDEAFKLVADAIAKAGSAADRARIANAAFSRSGVAMVNMLGDGRKGLEDFRAELESTGSIMTTQSTIAATVLTDKFTELSTIVGTKLKSAFIDASAAIAQLFGVYTGSDAITNRIAEVEASLEKIEALETRARTRQKAKEKALREELANLKKQEEVVEKVTEAITGTGETAEAAAVKVKGLFDMGALIQSSFIAPGVEAQKTLEDIAASTKFQTVSLSHVFGEPEEIEKAKSIWDEFGESVQFNIDLTKKFSDNIKSMVSSVLNELLKLGAQRFILNSLFPNAQGNAFGPNGVMAFAKGGVVNSPTVFPFASGGSFKTGLMGEAGPEAIMPLSRGADGDLGVKANISVNVHNNAGASVSVQENGNDIDIIINKIASDISRGGGKVARSMERAYGVSRARGATA
jgi:phage-related minor tail protein